MKKLSQTFENPKKQQTPGQKLSDAESRCDKSVLSDEELGQVSAAGDGTVPTMNPEVLLGRHALPADPQESDP